MFLKEYTRPARPCHAGVSFFAESAAGAYNRLPDASAASETEMAIIAGIDEAGFGPVLGPLVVSVAVFCAPEEAAEKCFWTLLATAVTRKAFRKSPLLPIADSKQMHVRTDGVIHLERGVLGTLAQQGAPPRTLRELVRRIAPGAEGAAAAYPWYAGSDLPLPRQASPDDLALRGNGLAEAMARCGLSLHALRAEPVFAGDYNRLISATRNKSIALFGVVGKLIAWTLACRRDGPVRIVVDHQGGRVRHVPHLQRMFERAKIRVLEETDLASRYQMDFDGRPVHLSFLVKGEDRHLPVALASMVSKYVRELYMELLNAWWAARVPGLKPTAGYATDGRRFLQDIDRAIAASGIDRDLLVRCR